MPQRLNYPKDTIIISRDLEKVGRTTGANYSCQMSGCNGIRITTKWEDNKVTHPCSKGITWDQELNSLKIL